MKSECPLCGEVFSGLSLFDLHQDVDYRRTPPIVCINPQKLGLVRGSNGTWTTLKGAQKINRVRRMGQSRRKAKT